MMYSGPMLVVPARAIVNVQNHAMHVISYNVMNDPSMPSIHAIALCYPSITIQALHFRHTRGSCYTQTTCMWSGGCCSLSGAHTCRCRWSFRPLLNLHSPLKYYDFYFWSFFFPRRRLRSLDIKQCQGPCCYGGAPCSWLARFTP